MSANVVSIRAGDKKNAQNAVSAMQALVSDEMKGVNQTILDRMQSPVSLIPQLAGHLIASGGKRLRPMLTLACAKLIGYEGNRHIKLAACVEFVHNATLLHDDVVDESELRRGQETANTIWGNQASVLVGDFLLSRSFELMVEDGSLKVLKILSGASSVIAEGEVLQLMATSDLTTTEETYLEVISAKTAVLFAAACEIAGVVAEQGEKVEQALAAYGQNLGIAFQLVDDALDYSASQEALGKTVGDDFREGKITLPIILAYRRGDETERAFWERTVGELEQKDSDLNQAMAYLSSHNTIDDTLARARHYGERAKDSLALFPRGDAHKCLNDIIEFVIARAS